MENILININIDFFVLRCYNVNVGMRDKTI